MPAAKTISLEVFSQEGLTEYVEAIVDRSRISNRIDYSLVKRLGCRRQDMKISATARSVLLTVFEFGNGASGATEKLEFRITKKDLPGEMTLGKVAAELLGIPALKGKAQYPVKKKAKESAEDQNAAEAELARLEADREKRERDKAAKLMTSQGNQGQTTKPS